MYSNLADNLSPVTPSVTNKPQTPFFTGGKTMKLRKKRLITGIKGRGAYLKNWSKQQPGYHDRTIMMRKCGKKCFLGPRKTFPICSRNTCKQNKKGIYAAYIRANEYKTILGNQKYRRISAKARKMLHRIM